MSNSNIPDERVVYLTLKNVFMGNAAQMRKLSTIRKLIQKERTQPDIEALVNAYGVDAVSGTARTLLIDHVFKETLRAKLRFPEVFDVSPTQTAEREAEEAEAVRHEADAISEVIQNNHVGGQAGPSVLQETGTTSTETCRQRKPGGHALYPTYLPIRSQNILLTKVQSLLEQACFRFAQRAMPEVLHGNHWDCPEAVELNRWIAEFSSRREQFLAMNVNIARSLEDVFRSVAAIRHTAVHRLRINGRRLEQYLVDAESFLTLLDDRTSSTVIGGLRRETQSILEELERNKHILNVKRERTQRKIAMQRAELDELERALVADMAKEDAGYQAQAGVNLEQAVVMVDVTSTSIVASGDDDVAISDADSVDNFEDSCSEILA